MSDASATYALAVSCTQPVQEFNGLAELACAIVARGPANARFTVRSGACTARGGRPEASLNVYSIAERAAFLGYVLGIDHQVAELEAALDRARGGA